VAFLREESKVAEVESSTEFEDAVGLIEEECIEERTGWEAGCSIFGMKGIWFDEAETLVRGLDGDVESDFVEGDVEINRAEEEEAEFERAESGWVPSLG
jgi:hypothetical protein